MYYKVFICILRKYTSKNKIFVHNLAGLSRSVSDTAGLDRQLKGLGIELYAPDRSINYKGDNEGCFAFFNLTIICLQFCCDLAIIYHTPHEVMRVSAIFAQKKFVTLT